MVPVERLQAHLLCAIPLLGRRGVALLDDAQRGEEVALRPTPLGSHALAGGAGQRLHGPGPGARACRLASAAGWPDARHASRTAARRAPARRCGPTSACSSARLDPAFRRASRTSCAARRRR